MLVACGPDIEVSPATVEWMEWPAEVSAAMPFQVRLLVSRPGCRQGAFKLGVSADESAVTLAPYYLIKSQEVLCLPEAGVVDVYPGAFDTVGTVPGLAVSFARTFEMRAAAQVYAPAAPGVGDLPIRTYGEVTVRLTSPDSSRRNGAGFAAKLVDNSGCVRLQPSGFFGPSGTAGSNLVVEDQSDTSSFANAFVRGYIYEASAPICGQTRVFHLVTVN
jgi:hypothetical protein